jgi:hypothetical protein
MASVSGIALVTTDNATPTTDIAPSGMTDYYANALVLAYGQSISERWALGLSTTLFLQDMQDISMGKGWGITFTPGVIYQWSDNVRFGMILRDIVNQQQWDTGTVETALPACRAGVAWWVWPNLVTAVDLEQDLRSVHRMTFYGGSEWRWNEALALRAGWNDGQITAGVGFALDGFYGDYAYIGNDQYQLGETYRISMGVKY